MPSSQVPFRNPDVPLEPTPTPSPEPTVWRKYSSHHEFPLSAMTSIILHFAVVLVIALMVAMIPGWHDWLGSPKAPEMGTWLDGGSGLGDGGPDRGESQNLEVGVPVDKAADADFAVTSPDIRQPDTPLIPVQPDKAKLGDSIVRAEGNRNDGGGGTGIGKNIGPGREGGRPKDMRVKRMDRWSLTFTYRSGEEYLQRLANLGAILALAEGAGKYQMIADVNERPVKTVAKTSDDLAKLGRIYWRQNDAEAMQALQRAMGLSIPPRYVLAFFPQDLEAELLRAELKHSKLSEAQLNAGGWKTIFNAEKSGGKWLVTVVEQTRPK